MKFDIMDRDEILSSVILYIFILSLIIGSLCFGCYFIGYHAGVDGGKAYVLENFKCENKK
jgi:hypothetical protein